MNAGEKFQWLLLMLFLIAGCSSCGILNNMTSPNDDFPVLQPIEIVDSSNAVSEMSGVTMRTEQEAYPQNTTEIVLLIDNKSNFNIGFGFQWQLEKYDDRDGFVLCQYEEQPSFFQRYDHIPRGVSDRYSIDMTYYGKYIQAGRYRLVVGPMAVENENFVQMTIDGVERFVLCAEFFVE